MTKPNKTKPPFLTVKKTDRDGKVTTYEYSGQNRLVKGTNETGETSEYVYNAMGARIQNVQTRDNVNMGYMNAVLDGGSLFIKDYMPTLSDGRNTWQRTWETKVGTTVQNNRETVTKNYVVDYLSMANRDIMVYEEGSFTQRNVYAQDGKRISTELTYAEGTQRGEPGENIASDTAVRLSKVWYRTSHLDSTLFAVDEQGEVVTHTIYDPWGNPQSETKTDLNYTGLDNRNNYTGYTWDVTLELYFAQARFYDPENHRFTQEDPFAGYLDEPMSLVKYLYVQNSPLKYTDPLGLDSYYFYDPKMWESGAGNTLANNWATALKREYGGTVHTIKISSKEELLNEWAKIDDTTASVDAVVMNFHSDPNGLEFRAEYNSGEGAVYISKEELKELSKKKVDLLLYLGCNAGNLNYNENIASVLSEIPGVTKVAASDGTVWNWWGGSQSDSGVASLEDDIWEFWRDQGKDNVTDYFALVICKDGANGIKQLDTDDRMDDTGINRNASWVMYQNGFRSTFSTPKRQSLLSLLSQSHALDLNDYLELNQITMVVGEPYMTVNGMRTEIDPGRGTTSVAVNNRTLLPIRTIIESMGGTAEWNPMDNTVTVRRNQTRITLTLGSNAADINTETAILDVPFMSINDRTMLPLRFISETLKAEVDWDQETNTVKINYYTLRK